MTPLDRFCIQEGIGIATRLLAGTGGAGVQATLVRDVTAFGETRTLRCKADAGAGPIPFGPGVTPAQVLRECWSRILVGPKGPGTLHGWLERFLGKEWAVVEALLAAEVAEGGRTA